MARRRPEVFYAYSELDQEVVDFLRSEPITLHLVNVGKKVTDYYDFLCRRWEAGKTFVLVEHDILPYPGAIQEIWDCEVALCGKPYQIHGGYVAAFGCTKFSAELIAAYPDAIVEGGKRSEPVGAYTGYKHWETLDSRVVYAMQDKGWGVVPNIQGTAWPHQHWPIVKHKKSYPGIPTTDLGQPPTKPDLSVTWYL